MRPPPRGLSCVRPGLRHGVPIPLAGGLLVAYEEGGSVLPVVSDFDAFLVGSKGVEYPSVPPEQVQFLHSLTGHVEGILKQPGEKVKRAVRVCAQQGAHSRCRVHTRCVWEAR